MKRTIQVAEEAGYCFGVRRALDMAKEYLTKHSGKAYSLGPIIHNPQVVEEFRRKGLIPVDSLKEVEGGVLLIRSHGVEKEILEQAQTMNIEVVDATCPFVKNAQRMARRLSEDGYQIILIGEVSHPEVKGIMSYSAVDPIVVRNADDLKGKSIDPKVGVLAQTTQTKENFIDVVIKVLDAAHECRAYNTICNATASRQTSSIALAKTVDVMFVVGGKNSANTTRLAELCRSAGTKTYHIESVDEITPNMIQGKQSVGITAGASTPRAQVEKIKQALEKIDD